MKYLKTYNESTSNESLEDICRKYGIADYTINGDGSIDVNGDVDISDKGLTGIPIKFRNVSGDFYCHYNKLTTLEGSPVSVGGDFHCGNNNLTTLEGSPESVRGGFYCYSNNLTTLEGSPKSVSGSFDCRNNNLTTLEGSPESVGGDFYCHYNPVNNLWKLFNDYSKIEFFNSADIVRDIDGKPGIIIDRLNFFLKEIRKSTVQEVDGYINI